MSQGKNLGGKEEAMTSPEHLRWLEAAYLYYLHPEHDPIMSDAEWDYIGRSLEKQGIIESFGSLFQMKEEDYPKAIREKYEN